MSAADLRHHLLAILAADAAAYTRLMALDDGATLRALEAARTVFRAQTSAEGGRVIDTAGDSWPGPGARDRPLSGSPTPTAAFSRVN